AGRSRSSRAGDATPWSGGASQRRPRASAEGTEPRNGGARHTGAGLKKIRRPARPAKARGKGTRADIIRKPIKKRLPPVENNQHEGQPRRQFQSDSFIME
ncbi:MAG: hypothetical protein J6I53_05755, partial [Treponema sp.]|nr:hypothetical protein [Treponema sp.]